MKSHFSKQGCFIKASDTVENIFAKFIRGFNAIYEKERWTDFKLW